MQGFRDDAADNAEESGRNTRQVVAPIRCSRSLW